MSRRSLLVTLLLACSLPPVWADGRPADPGATWDRSRNKDGRWNQTDVGPFLASVLPTPTGTIAKGLSIKVGNDTTIAYDLATMTPRAAWTGGFLKFDAEKFGIVRAPQIDGEVQWVDAGPAWGKAKIRFFGHAVQQGGVIFEYAVDGVRVQESVQRLPTDGATVVRTFRIGSADRDIRLLLPLEKSKHPVTLQLVEDVPERVAKPPLNEPAIKIRAGRQQVSFKVISRAAVAEPDTGNTLAAEVLKLPTLKLPKRRWEPVVTKGETGASDSAYVVDTIGVPFENPWNSLMFLTGLDFLPDGTLAVCTLYGEVWLVRGVDDGLDEVAWHRFATGLHQPLGLKVVDGEVHVLGRDQITRLQDIDGNGEADTYVNVNNAGQTSTSGHDYAACLETDPDGNLYYIRAHEGVVRVSKDGARSESIAKGFRNPVGLGVSPTGMVTAAPQEGTWTPASGIFEVKENGWYGFAGPKVTPDRPLGYDPPICWMPRLQDNSSGGQTWAPEKGFGPLSGMMLHFSYGQCAMLAVPFERVDGVAQGATVRLPMFFESGVMRGRFGSDGHLYVCGLRGWQTSAAKDGCLQRVRCTGKPAHLPVEFHVKRTGVELVFSEPLDRESAGDPQNWAVEQWNYRYSKEYGSKDYLVSEPRKTGREEVFLEDVEVSDDGRTVRLVFEEDVVPVMQMGITYDVRAADGTELRDVLYGTVNKVPAR